MKKMYVYPIVIMLVFAACKSSKSSATPEQINIFNELVSSKEFTIESEWAYPQMTNAMTQVMNSSLMWPRNNAGTISLIGNPNFLTIKGDSVKSYLPYFGERQMQVAYAGTDSAIQFDGLMKDFTIEEGKNNTKIISFKAKSNNEGFNVVITLYPNLKAEMGLQGSSRFFIQYRGDVMPLPKAENQS